MITYDYNPSHLGDGDWEDHDLKPVWAKSSSHTPHINQ
jgi:hypothetical protein